MDERTIFIRGKKVYLKAINETDIHNSNWFGWFNDEETSIHLQKHYYPNTLEKQIAFFNSFKNDNTKLVLGVVAASNQETLIGVASLQGINYVNRTAEISLVIGEKNFRGLVFAEETMRLLIEHAFNTLNLNKIHLGYLESLKPWGVFLQRKFGFVIEGELVEHVFKNGKYMSVELLGLLQRNYLKKNLNRKNKNNG